MSIIYEYKRKNYLINGQFQVFQRGGSQTTSGFGSDDRWYNTHNDCTKTHVIQSFAIGQTEVPWNPIYYSQTNPTSISSSTYGYVTKGQNIENVRLLSGKTVTLSFWAKSSMSMNIATEFSQHFGISGSPSVYSIGITTHNITTSWKKFQTTTTIPSISGKTITDGDHTRIDFWLDAGSDVNYRTNSLGHQSGIFQFSLANVQLEEGNVVTEFEKTPYAQDLFACQRFFEKGYFGQIKAVTPANSNYYCDNWVYFLTTKRAAPTVSISNTTFTNGNNWSIIYPSTSILSYIDGFRLSANGINVPCMGVYFDWSADAELAMYA